MDKEKLLELAEANSKASDSHIKYGGVFNERGKREKSDKVLLFKSLAAILTTLAEMEKTNGE